MQASYLSKRFVIVAGKGGVGKSTACAALGLAAARKGKRVIIAELNTREKAPLFFGKPESGYKAQQIAPNLFSINIQPEPALREYGLRKLRLKFLYDSIFESAAMKKLLRMIPGMNELPLLGKAFDLEREVDRRGKPVWDMVIVDAPATGHGVSLLRLPEVILNVSTTGAMADEARLMRALLTDAARTVIHLVTLPEEMPVRETLELKAQVENVLNIPEGYLLINGVWPHVINNHDLEVMRTLRDAAGSDRVVASAMACLRSLVRRRRLQEGYLEELRIKVDMPTVQVPYLFVEHFDGTAIGILADHILKNAVLVESRRARRARRPGGAL